MRLHLFLYDVGDDGSGDSSGNATETLDCFFTLRLKDSWGDGWDGAEWNLTQRNGSSLITVAGPFALSGSFFSALSAFLFAANAAPPSLANAAWDACASGNVMGGDEGWEWFV